ncbi:ACP S-malonyltransferase [Nocardia sp. NPDC051570]|uniref:ACP S-malonyltransferase n=1 Tax=Nocardia sp. NPDC051570 TaxID=3364324 RepID=UPI00379CE74C
MGVLKQWVRTPKGDQLVAEWSDACGVDLLYAGVLATEDELIDTEIAQPLIVAAAVIACELLPLSRFMDTSTVVAGHSVGELSALAIAGVVSAREAVVLAAERGRLMAKACAAEPTGMAALGGESVESVVTMLADLHLGIAVNNGHGQITVAGRVDAIEALLNQLPSGVRARRIPVSGAFHSSYMNSAEIEFREILSTIDVRDPWCVLLSNSDGNPVDSGRDAVDKLVRQMTRQVRWDLCLDSIHSSSPAYIVELPPAGILTRLSLRLTPSAIHIEVRSPEDLGLFDALQ